MPAVIDVSIFNISTFDRLRAAPFGEDYIYEHSSSWITPYTFSGKEKDSETGYSYFGARYYDSELSVWLSVDPLDFKYPSQSPYSYVGNRPVNTIDPWGMDEVKDPNGKSNNAGDGYKATNDGKYLYGDGLKTKVWKYPFGKPHLVI